LVSILRVRRKISPGASFNGGLAVHENLNLLVDGFSSPEDTGSHSAHGAVHDDGDFFVAQTLELPKSYCRFKILGQTLDGLVDHFLQFVAEQQVLGSILIFQSITPCIELRIVHVHIRGRWTTTACDQMVLGSVDGDAVQPSIERTVPTEIAKCSIGFNKSFLSNIMHFAAVPNKASDDRQDLMLVLQYQQIKGALVPFLDALHQLLICFLRRLRCHLATPNTAMPTVGARDLQPFAYPSPPLTARPYPCQWQLNPQAMRR